MKNGHFFRKRISYFIKRSTDLWGERGNNHLQKHFKIRSLLFKIPFWNCSIIFCIHWNNYNCDICWRDKSISLLVLNNIQIPTIRDCNFNDIFLPAKFDEILIWKCRECNTFSNGKHWSVIDRPIFRIKCNWINDFNIIIHMIIEIISHKGSTRMHERFYRCTVSERANFRLPESFIINASHLKSFTAWTFSY